MATTVNLSKVRTDILDLIGKRDTLIYVLDRDIEEIDADSARCFREIGEKAFDCFIQGVDSIESMSEDFERIKELQVNKDAKKAKIVEIAARYDEEIELLQKLLPDDKQEEAATETEIPPRGYCPTCATAYKVGEDIFCMTCGTRLEPAPAP